MTEMTFDQRHRYRTQAELTAGFAQMFRAAAATIAVWHQRSRQREDLMMVDARLLRDMGLTEWDRQYEASKAFWQA